jgi:hypothetical protein
LGDEEGSRLDGEEGSKFRVQGSEFSFRVQGSGFTVPVQGSGSGFGGTCTVFSSWAFGFRDSDTAEH